MLNHLNYAITLGRAVDAFRRGEQAVPEQKLALRSLVGVARIDAAVIEVERGTLQLAGIAVSPSLPGVSTLLGQLEGHDIAEIRIDRGASAASLFRLLRGLAEPMGGFRLGDDLATRLREAGITDVSVRLRDPTASAPPPRPEAAAEEAAVVAALRDARRLSHPEAAVATIALSPEAPEVERHLRTATVRIAEELEHGRPSGAVRALAQLIQLADGVAAGPGQDTLRDAVEPLLTAAAFRGALDCAADAATQEAAVRVLRRGGTAATAVLRDRLLAAEDEATARRILTLLRGQPEGLRSVILLLQHADGAIARRAAALLGSLDVREAVPALVRAVRHPETWVRAAVAGALARLATPEAMQALAEVIDDAGEGELPELVEAVGGARHDVLVARLDAARLRIRDPRALGAIGHALGRIGTPDAVGALARWAEGGGWRFWRRGGSTRLAAVEGLRLAGGPAAQGILERLTRDGSPEVRRAAGEAVEDLSIAAQRRAP